MHIDKEMPFHHEFRYVAYKYTTLSAVTKEWSKKQRKLAQGFQRVSVDVREMERGSN